VEEEIKENEVILDLTKFDISVQLTTTKVQAHAKEKQDIEDKDGEEMLNNTTIVTLKLTLMK